MKKLILAIFSLIVIAGCSPQQAPLDTGTPAPVTSSPTLVTPSPEPTKLSVDAAAWLLGKEFSIAAIMKGGGADEADLALASGTANDAATILGLTAVPPLFEMSSDQDTTDGMVAALAYILDNGKPMASSIREKHGEKTAALFELAYRTNIIGLLYEPGDENSLLYAGQLEKVGGEYNLPLELWQPVVESIKADADGEAVRRNISKMTAEMAPRIAEQ